MSSAEDRRGLELLACTSPGKSGRWRRDSLSDNALVKCQSVRPVTSCSEARMRFPPCVHSSRSTKWFQELRCVGYEFVCALDGALSAGRVVITRCDQGGCEAPPLRPFRSLFQIVFTLAILHRYDSK